MLIYELSKRVGGSPDTGRETLTGNTRPLLSNVPVQIRETPQREPTPVPSFSGNELKEPSPNPHPDRVLLSSTKAYTVRTLRSVNVDMLICRSLLSCDPSLLSSEISCPYYLPGNHKLGPPYPTLFSGPLPLFSPPVVPRSRQTSRDPSTRPDRTEDTPTRSR